MHKMEVEKEVEVKVLEIDAGAIITKLIYDFDAKMRCAKIFTTDYKTNEDPGCFLRFRRFEDPETQESLMCKVIYKHKDPDSVGPAKTSTEESVDFKSEDDYWGIGLLLAKSVPIISENCKDRTSLFFSFNGNDFRVDIDSYTHSDPPGLEDVPRFMEIEGPSQAIEELAEILCPGKDLLNWGTQRMLQHYKEKII